MSGDGRVPVTGAARWGRVALVLAAVMLLLLLCGAPVFLFPLLPNPETGEPYTPRPEGYRLLCLAPAMGFGAAAFLAGRARVAGRPMSRAEGLFMAAVGLGACLLVGGLAMAVLPPPEGYGLEGTPFEVKTLAWLCGFGPGIAVIAVAIALGRLSRRGDGEHF